MALNSLLLFPLLSGLQGKEHGPHAAGHCGSPEEQQERLHLWPDRNRPSGHFPLGRPAGVFQSCGGLQGGGEETPGEEEW